MTFYLYKIFGTFYVSYWLDMIEKTGVSFEDAEDQVKWKSRTRVAYCYNNIQLSSSYNKYV